ncbi:hypothetical protein I315_05005 [Cryptococcus gattii Ru294]|uniref:Uncharacterized protein n=2 Tax=Cryptococcus gattii TaxID=37769 RepID=E6R7L5_CRYGW|nr:Hypothetical Protein CGB_F0340C [Cryptococcus gattii WM276]KIR52405.1 hypothetical protein I315_05005 [Cryptococcus gattii Ru294]KIR82772.1 hypothetical protein I306_00037 [Cryptococcus gattii EJB2]KIY32339.1 hypothetical protein I305_05298 [Cryptococcus gattii E566]KJE04657.1 hypothetical protein I311_01456 [Cryptococcus gattii NT-10]ADV22800.1 Hypothetical Protein CGB_F0340C [Cryptococcus gattii WM276]
MRNFTTCEVLRAAVWQKGYGTLNEVNAIYHSSCRNKISSHSTRQEASERREQRRRLWYTRQAQ